MSSTRTVRDGTGTWGDARQAVQMPLTETGGGPCPKLGVAARQRIGDGLRSIYGEAVHADLPDDLAELAASLDRAGRP